MDYSVLFIKRAKKSAQDISVMPAMVCVSDKDGTCQYELRTSTSKDIMKSVGSKFSSMLGNSFKSKRIEEEQTQNNNGVQQEDDDFEEDHNFSDGEIDEKEEKKEANNSSSI